MALILAGCGGASTTAPATAQPSATAATTPTPSTGSGFVDFGRVLTPADFGRPSGSIIGDPTGVLLQDGRIRLFVYVEGQGVWRALSTDAEGTAFRVEGACTLIPDAATNTMGTPGFPAAIRT